MCFKVLKILKRLMYLTWNCLKMFFPQLAHLKSGYIFIQFQTFVSTENLPGNHIYQKIKCNLS